MNKQAFKERMKSLKSYRELNPDKGYWDWKVLAFDGGGGVKEQLEIKDPPTIKSHTAQSDNIVDYRPIVVELRIERKPKDGEVVHYDVHGNRYVYTPTNAKIIADTRTQYQKERDLENAAKAAQVYTEAKNKEKALKTVGTLGLLVSPSTYVGPIFGDKPYAEGVVSGEGFGDISTNILADTFMFGLASGLKNQVSEQIALRDAFKFVDDVPVNSSVKPKIRTKLGDIEIDNPQLYYRQGSKDMANDFLKTGVVNAKGGFTNPLFAKGNLWYGIPDEHSLKPSSVFVTNERGVVFDLTKSNESVPKTHLLVSNAPMEAANKHSSFIPITIKNTQPYPIKDLEMKSWENINMLDEAVSYNTAYYRGDLLPITTRAVDRSGGRRIPAFEGAANKNNTELYEFIPGYGYKHVNQTSKVVPAYGDGTDGDDEKLYIGRTDQDYYGNLTHNIVVDTNGDEVNFGLPDVVITPKNNLSLGTYNYNKKIARNVADAVSFVPGVGEVIDATVAAQDASKGDYTTAAGLGLGLFIPNVIEKPLKWMWKGGKKIMQNSLSSVADLMENHSPQGRFAVGFANDLLTQPSRTFKALREGTYPTSYTKVSLLVRKLHEELLDKKIAHWNMVTNDFDRNVQLRKDMLNGELLDEPHIDYLSFLKGRINDTFFNFPEYMVGRSFRNHGESSSLLGFHDGNKAVTKVRHRTNFIDIDDVVGTSVHERLHEINKILPYYNDLTAYSPSADYYTVSGDGEHFITDVFKFQNASVVDAAEKGYRYETWQSSPSEFLAELANYRVMFADGRNYSEMTPEQREKIAEKMTSRFYTPMTAYYSGKTDDELQTIMMDKLKTLDVFGYSDGGIVGKKKLKRSLKNKQKENKSN